MSKSMVESSRPYLPAAGHDFFLPLYDPIVKLLGGESARRALLDQAALRPGQRILEIGCGTGSLVIMIKHLYPRVDVIGLDPDPRALARARRKVSREALCIQFDQGFADQIPYPDASFEHVFSSFMFHHLPPDEKSKTLHSVRRVLKPAGEFHMVDFEGPEDGSHGFLAHLLHSNHRLEDNSERRVLSLLGQSGFSDSKKTGRRSMLFGGVGYYRAIP